MFFENFVIILLKATLPRDWRERILTRTRRETGREYIFLEPIGFDGAEVRLFNKYFLIKR